VSCSIARSWDDFYPINRSKYDLVTDSIATKGGHTRKEVRS
jgi:hypothetical protein